MARIILSNSVLMLDSVSLVEFGVVDDQITVFFTNGQFRNYSGEDAKVIMRCLKLV